MLLSVDVMKDSERPGFRLIGRDDVQRTSAALSLLFLAIVYGSLAEGFTGGGRRSQRRSFVS